MGSTPWTINSEIYPLHVIGTANSLSASTNWISNALVAELFPILTYDSVRGEVIVYCTLALFALLCFIFTYCMIPETANKEIKDILAEILGPVRKE